jgi:hypothetical protein
LLIPLKSITFETLDYTSDEKFWPSISSAIRRVIYPEHRDFPQFASPTDLLDFFSRYKWTEDIVLLIDEFSELAGASLELQDSFLRAFRAIRNQNETYAIKSIIAAGTFSILNLNSKGKHVSPFNAREAIFNDYFTLPETHQIFEDFSSDNDVNISPRVIDEIWNMSNG